MNIFIWHKHSKLKRPIYNPIHSSKISTSPGGINVLVLLMFKTCYFPIPWIEIQIFFIRKINPWLGEGYLSWVVTLLYKNLADTHKT